MGDKKDGWGTLHYACLKPAVRGMIKALANFCRSQAQPEHENEYNRKLRRALDNTARRTSFISERTQPLLMDGAELVMSYAQQERVWFPFIMNVLMDEFKKAGIDKKQDLTRAFTKEMQIHIERQGEGDQLG